MTRKTLSQTLLASLVAPLALVGLGSGCVINNPPPEPLDGSITFAWSFGGIRSCEEAGVAEVDVQVVDDLGVAFSTTVECYGGGLTLTDFSPGAYEVLLDAYSRSNRLLFQGDGFVQVRPGVENDMGVIELVRVGSQPNSTGALAFYWGFLYPTDDSLVIDCAVAGADEVLLDVRSSDGTVSFVESFPCEDEGVILEDLPTGRYSILLEAYGRYQRQDLLLYEGVFDVNVAANTLKELGDLPLLRVYESFSDIEVSWDIPGTCAEAQVREVVVVITRMEGNIEDDVVIVDCDRSYALRETFVPGSYFVEVYADGYYGEYYGSVTRDVPPNITAVTRVQLVPAP